MSHSINKDTSLKLIESARQAAKNAYCPYSNYNVGAAVLTYDEKIYTGCNVENSAYSQTIHAEENAVSQAIADGLIVRASKSGIKQTEIIKALSVFAPKGSQPWPCCNCRQFLCEFGLEFVIVGFNQDNEIVSKQLKELVPYMFPIENVLSSIKEGKGFNKNNS